MIHVFVYGSLKRGFRNHHFLATSRFIGTGTTHCCFDLLDLGYFPAMIKPGTFAIRGELFSVDRHTLKNLDRLEGNTDGATDFATTRKSRIDSSPSVIEIVDGCTMLFPVRQVHPQMHCGTSAFSPSTPQYLRRVRSGSAPRVSPRS
jgi:gamma-glutamylcyclotransferase (GGCT)/AIG2-like uncharacterized protein YtfP